MALLASFRKSCFAETIDKHLSPLTAPGTPVTKDVVLFNNNITDVNADAELDPLVLRYASISFGHAARNLDGASHGIDYAGELNERAVPGILDDASAMISDFGIKKRLSKSFQLRQRAFFVDPYQAARARDFRCQNSRQSTLDVLAAQDAPPGSGKLIAHIAQLWADVRLCPRPKWVIRDRAEPAASPAMSAMPRKRK